MKSHRLLLSTQETEFSQLGSVSRQNEVEFVPAAMSPRYRYLSSSDFSGGPSRVHGESLLILQGRLSIASNQHPAVAN
jgi:hypothetical protein